MRREFDLGPEDVRALEALGRSWETVCLAGVRWLFIQRYPVPPGFNHAEVTLALRLDTYPGGLIDMAYFHPPLARMDGKVVNNLSTLAIGTRTFQQWSRHYGWKEGVDSLARHLRRVRSWLTHEFRKR